MIKLLNWLIRFTVWILLYYIINYKIFNVITDESIQNLPNFNSFVLYLSIGLSFLMSFHSKLISIKNIKYHLYTALTIGIIPIIITILNWGISALNLITPYINAPLLKLIEFKLSIVQNSSCGCNNIGGFGPAYLVITVLALIMVVMHSYIWESTCGEHCDDSLYDDGDWDDE